MTRQQSSARRDENDELEGRLQAVYEGLRDDEQTAHTLRSQEEVQGYSAGHAGEAKLARDAVRWVYSRFGGLS